MQRYQWESLNKQQLGRFYEQHVQMELAMRGFELYPPAVDDHGVDLVARWHRNPFLELQTKAIRKLGYVFLRKKYFRPDPAVHVALGLHVEGQEPVSLLIPSMVWKQCEDDPLLKAVFCENDYEGLKSEPEYGLRLSAARFEALRERFDLGAMLAGLCMPALDSRFLRAVFCDAFLFCDAPRSHLQQHPELTPEQADLAMAIHASALYPVEMEKTMALAHALQGTFPWQDNSEGPLVFASKVLYLLERHGRNAAWFIDLWEQGQVR